jgi:signal peptidase I
MSLSWKISKFSKYKKYTLTISMSCIFLLWYFYVYGSSTSCPISTIRWNSMYPTFYSGDTVRVCRDTRYRHEDIVAFRLRDTHYVKRIIALPWDRIIFGKDGYIYRNDERLMEPYIHGDIHFRTASLHRLLIQIDRYGGIVPSHMLIVFGDNRKMSLDSSEYGMIDFDQLIGKVYINSHF